LLFIKTDAFVIDEEIIKLWGPIIFPGIPILIWLRPRIKLLDLKNKNGKGDPLSGYIFAAWIIIAVPNVIAQGYLITATGKLTSLANINQINKFPKTKYYAVNHFYVDKRLIRPKSTFEVSGKYNADFDMTIYVPCPVFDKNHNIDTVYHQSTLPQAALNGKPLIVVNGRVVDKNFSKNYLVGLNPQSIKSINVIKGTSAAALYGNAAKDGVILITTKGPAAQIKPDINADFTPVAWIALKYQETISNHLPADRKNDLYKAFARKCQKDFNYKSLDDFYYLDRMAYSSDLKNYTAAINSDKYSALNTPIIVLSPVYEPFESRNGNKLAWIFGSLSIGSVIFLIILLFKPLRIDALDIDLDEVRKKDASTALLWIKGLFIPKKTHFGTQMLIELNLLIFIIMVFAGLGFISFNGIDLLKWGANYRPSILNGEYWRLLTNIFLHGGLMHVLFNMYALFFVGIFLEPVMGTAKYILVYLFTGIIASIASAWWHVATVSVGASGAIFGLYGVFFALLTVNVFSKDLKKSFLISTAIFIVYNLIYGLTGGIDNAAHIGGLLSGLLLGYMMYPSLKNKIKQDESGDETQKILDELAAKTNKPTIEHEAES